MADDDASVELMAPGTKDAVATVKLAGRHDAMIEAMFAEFFHGSPHMRDTDAYNHVRRFTDALKKRLAEEN